MQRRRGGRTLGPDRSVLRFVLAAVASGLLGLGCLLVFTSDLPATTRAQFGDVISFPLAAAAAGCCAAAARRSAARVRLAWGLLAAGCACWAVAEASWAVDSYLPGGSSAPWLADALYLLGIPWAIAGLLAFPSDTYRGSHRLRSVLDAVTVGGSIFFISGVLLGPPPMATDQTLANLLALIYPIGDMVMLSLALAALIRGPVSRYLPLALISAALLSSTIGDAGYVAMGDYTAGTTLDLTWILSYLLIGLAALAPRTIRPAGTGALREYRVSALPWAVVGVAQVAVAATAILYPRHIGRDPIMIAAGAVVVLTFAARQAWLLWDVLKLNKVLHHQLARSAQIAHSVIDGILVANRRGLVRYVNDSAAAMLQRDADSLLGTRLVDLVLPGSAASDAAGEVVAAIETGAVLTQGTASFPRADGSEIPVELSVGPFTMGGRLAGVAVVFRDVTDRRAVERMKNELMSVISHELRTPLTSIRGALAMLDGGMGGPLQPTGSRMVTLALQSSERLSRLINDILDVERLESGTLQLTVVPHPAATLVQNAVREMSGMAVPAGVRLTVGRTDGRVLADPDRILQTLTNLVGNAVKFSPAGSEVVLSCGTRGVGPEAVVEFSVQDQGRGIPAEKRDRIFDRFEQVDSSDARRHGGTGLGLAICRDIVHLHDGRIWVSAGAGGLGSDFRFTLPVAAPDPVAAPTAEPAVSRGA